MTKTVYILGLCFLFTVVNGINENKRQVESTMSGIQIKETLLPGEQPQNESSTLLFTLDNFGSLQNGLANLNLMHSVELKEAFQRVRALVVGKVKCKTFTTPAAVVFKFCSSSNDSKVEGTYSSTIKIMKTIRYIDDERVISYILYTTMDVEMSHGTHYERCSVNHSELDKQYSQQQTLDTIKYERNKGKKMFKVHELIMPRLQYITIVYMKKPQFFRVVLTEPPGNEYNKTDVCHIFDGQKSNIFKVKPQQCNIPKTGQHEIKKKIDESVTLKFEEGQEEYSMLMYDSAREHELQNLLQRDQVKDPRFLHLVGMSKSNIPNKVSVERVSNGTMFSFAFDEDDTTEDKKDDDVPAHSLIVFLHDQPDDDTKQIETTKEPKKSEEVREEVLNWMMNDKNDFDADHTTTKDYKIIPAKCSSKQLTCGIAALEMVREKHLPLTFNIQPDFMIVLKTKMIMDQDGNEVGPKDKNEAKFVQGKLLVNKKQARNSKILLEMNPAFIAKVKRTVRYIKRSITAKYGKKVWKTFTYSSELVIIRRLKCTNAACSGAIRAMLEYNITRTKTESTPPERHGYIVEQQKQNKQQIQQQQQQQQQQQLQQVQKQQQQQQLPQQLEQQQQQEQQKQQQQQQQQQLPQQQKQQQQQQQQLPQQQKQQKQQQQQLQQQQQQHQLPQQQDQLQQ